MNNPEKVKMLAEMVKRQNIVQDHKRINQMDLRLLNRVGYRTIKNPVTHKLELA